jgi:hypothetical protein
MNDQNEQPQTCEEIHIVMNFTIRSYAACPGAKLFLEWFANVFSKDSPQLAKGFTFRPMDYDGHALLEVQAHDALFTIDALESLWYQYKANKRVTAAPATPDDDKKVIQLKGPAKASSTTH